MKKSEALAIYHKLEPAAANRDAALVRQARTLAGLQAKRRGLRARLRELDRQIRVVKKQLRTTMNERDWRESGAASRVLGG
ncbi:MAG TPA: hypothetical protein VM531_09080 [Sphingomicrobium sp.]|jgi:hypothetical protein|nr:hypothetical protein [Sphingomicrobium sp.]